MLKYFNWYVRYQESLKTTVLHETITLQRHPVMYPKS